MHYSLQSDWVIIIPTLNRPDEIVRTLRWLMKCKTQPVAIYIIDQSKERNNEIENDFCPNYNTIHYIFIGYPLGSGKARNYLLNKISSKYILFLDDDVHSDNPDLDLIELYANQFKENRCVTYIDGGYFPTEINKNFNREAIINLKQGGGFINLLTTTYNNPTEIVRPTIGLTAGNFAIKTTVFDIVNGFDERFGLGEDRELGFRLWCLGYVGVNNKLCRLIHRKAPNGGIRNSKKKIINSTDPLIFLFGFENFPKAIVKLERKYLVLSYGKQLSLFNIRKSIYAFLKVISVYRAYYKAYRMYLKME